MGQLGSARLGILHSLLPLNAAIGAFVVVAVVAAAARSRTGAISARRRLLGWTLIGVPLEAAVAAHLLLRLSSVVDEALFAAGAVAFAAGAFLILGREDDTGLRRGDDFDPPWWPEFERRLHAYSTTRPTARRDRTAV